MKKSLIVSLIITLAVIGWFLSGKITIGDENPKDQSYSQVTSENNDISKNNNLLHLLFFREQVLGKSTILLEKLPINNFRLKFLKKSFPNARYIYLSRNGLEVSKSFEKRI